MKKIGLITGIILTLMGLFQGARYLFYYNDLTAYGKGFVWGSVLLILVGVLLIFFGLKKK